MAPNFITLDLLTLQNAEVIGTEHGLVDTSVDNGQDLSSTDYYPAAITGMQTRHHSGYRLQELVVYTLRFQRSQDITKPGPGRISLKSIVMLVYDLKHLKSFRQTREGGGCVADGLLGKVV